MTLTLQQIYELDEKRTQGEWNYNDGADPTKYITTIFNERGDSFAYTCDGTEQQIDDAAFIAAAPDMVRLLREQQKEIEGYREALEFYAERAWKTKPIYFPETPERVDWSRAPIETDKGQVARAALAQPDNKENV